MVKNILVTGATGKQGGALIDALLANSKSSWKIYALTRDSKTPSAQRLLNKGGESVELVEGDLNNQEFLDAFLQPTKDIYAIFSVQSMDLTQGNSAIKKEIEQGIRLADAAKKANVKHFVYTGSGGSERKSGVPHFDSKWVIEEHIRRIELPYTILRPVFFMDNFLDQGTGGKVTGAFFRYQMAKGRKLQMISVRDIGYFAFLALQNPAEYLGKEIEIAGDDLTFDEANEIYKRHNDGQDLPCTYSIATTVIKLVNKEVKTMFNWFDKKGYIADIPKLKKSYPELSDFDSFLQKSKEKH